MKPTNEITLTSNPRLNPVKCALASTIAQQLHQIIEQWRSIDPEIVANAPISLPSLDHYKDAAVALFSLSLVFVHSLQPFFYLLKCVLLLFCVWP